MNRGFDIFVDNVGNAFIAGTTQGPPEQGDDVLLLIYELDTDGDSLSDTDEINVYGTDPSNSDTDSDGLSDGDEINVHGTDPNNPDTDNDGLSDGDEINIHGTDPNNPLINPITNIILIITIPTIIIITGLIIYFKIRKKKKDKEPLFD